MIAGGEGGGGGLGERIGVGRRVENKGLLGNDGFNTDGLDRIRFWQSSTTLWKRLIHQHRK